jgi:hypothetical protein
LPDDDDDDDDDDDLPGQNRLLSIVKTDIVPIINIVVFGWDVLK